MDFSAGMLVGAVIGAAVIVRLFLLLAGAQFSSVRQILAAYGAAAIAAVFISAAGLADGGPPNYSGTALQISGSALACAVEIFLLARSQRRALAQT